MKAASWRTATAALALLLLTTYPAHAYLDPGTGSMLLQGLIGAIAGGLLVFKLYWAKIKERFRSLTGKTKNASGHGDGKRRPLDS